MYAKPRNTGGTGAAYGYTQHENSLQPKIMSDIIVPRFRRELVASSFTSPVWFDPLRRAGNTVEYMTAPCVVAQDYVKNQQMKAQTPTMSKRTMTLGEMKYIDIKVDEVDEARIAGFGRFIRAFSASAAEAFAEECDKTVIKKAFTHIHSQNRGSKGGCDGCEDLGSCTAPLPWNPNTILRTLLKAQQIMDDWNVPEGQRFILLHNRLCVALQQYMAEGGGGQCCPPSDLRDNVFRGVMAQDLLGFRIIKSNCVPQCGKGTYKVLFGSTRAIGFATVLTQSRVVQDINSFEKRYQWLMLYGCDTMFPEHLGQLVVTTEIS